MRSFTDAMDAADPSTPFSNGSESDAWMQVWCETCVQDTPEKLLKEGGCPLVMVALMFRTPAEWKRGPVGSVERKYECEEYERIPQREKG